VDHSLDADRRILSEIKKRVFVLLISGIVAYLLTTPVLQSYGYLYEIRSSGLPTADVVGKFLSSVILFLLNAGLYIVHLYRLLLLIKLRMLRGSSHRLMHRIQTRDERCHGPYAQLSGDRGDLDEETFTKLHCADLDERIEIQKEIDDLERILLP